MQTLVLTSLFLLYVGYREWQHGSHVRDLEAKLMAKNVQEYVMIKESDRPSQPIEQPPQADFIDPFDANPDEFLAARGDGL